MALVLNNCKQMVVSNKMAGIPNSDVVILTHPTANYLVLRSGLQFAGDILGHTNSLPQYMSHWQNPPLRETAGIFNQQSKNSTRGWST